MNLEKLAVQVDKDYDRKFEELLAVLTLTTAALRGYTPDGVIPVLEQADAALCPECLAYLRKHDHRCKLHPDHDPTPE